MDKIKLIIGLGNPGKDYENTRHNAGFLFIDELARQLKTSVSNYTTPGRSSENRIIENQKLKVVLAKIWTFMNESGQTVLALAKQYKVKPENILIVHDDIDILWGNFKFSFGRSSAGHKGVESVIKSLKTKNFWRLRIGIQPASPSGGPSLKKHVPADKIILKKFTPAEEKALKITIKRALSHAPKIGFI